MASPPRERPPDTDPFDAAAEYAAGYVSDGSGDGADNSGKPPCKQRREPCELTPGSRQPNNRRAVNPEGVVDMEADSKLDHMITLLERLQRDTQSNSEQLSELNAKVEGALRTLNGLTQRVSALEEGAKSDRQRTADEITRTSKQLKLAEQKGRDLEQRMVAVSKMAEEAVRDAASAKRSVPKVGRDMPAMPEFQALHAQVQSLVKEFGGGAGPSGSAHAHDLLVLQEQVKELLARPQGGPATHAAHAPPPPGVLVGEALAREKAELGLRVKLEGLVEHKEGQSELQLCAAASQALSRKFAGGVKITVQYARWLKPPAGEQKPKRLMLGLGSEAMVRAVLSLKHGTPSKLATDERIMSEFGPVEMAVRNVLWDEVRAYTGAGRAWVGRSCLFVEGKPQALSEQAIKAGMEALGKPRARSGPRA